MLTVAQVFMNISMPLKKSPMTFQRCSHVRDLNFMRQIKILKILDYFPLVTFSKD